MKRTWTETIQARLNFRPVREGVGTRFFPILAGLSADSKEVRAYDNGGWSQDRYCIVISNSPTDHSVYCMSACGKIDISLGAIDTLPDFEEKAVAVHSLPEPVRENIQKRKLR